MSAHTDAIIARAALQAAQREARYARAASWAPAPWTGMHGGRKAEASTSADVYVGDTALYAGHASPDGAMACDRAQAGWSGAWARKNTTRAGKAERKSIIVGSDHGARRGDAAGWPTYKAIHGLLA